MTTRITIVGAGSLGSRHLQALARLDVPLVADVVDPADAPLTLALQRLQEAGGLKAGTAYARRAVSEIDTAPDIAIVATNARERRSAVEALLAAGTRTFIMEKVLFTRLADFDEIERALVDTGASAWVNLPRRSYLRAKALRDRVNGLIAYRVAGTGWGLACNVIHHIDDLEYLTGSPLASLDTSGLLPGFVASKRAGYIELLGTLRGTTERGDTFVAECSIGEAGDRIVSITSGGASYAISQLKQEMVVDVGQTVTIEPYPVSLQSQATADHITALIEGRAPALPTYQQSARAHRIMIAAFLDHLRRTADLTDPDECPIT